MRHDERTIAQFTPNCHCSSYKFPHRPGSGQCSCKVRSRYALPKELDQLCETCGQPAEPIDVDFGIGAYEYWGQKCNDVNVQTVSECCEAPLIDNSEQSAKQHPEWFNDKPA